MKQKLLFVFLLLGIVYFNSHAQPKTTTTSPAVDTSKGKPIPGIADKIKSSKKTSGLFTLHQDTING